jgi:hypothetical protein
MLPSLENGRNTFLQNASKPLRNYMASHVLIHTAVLSSPYTVQQFLRQECIHSSYSSEEPEKIINTENTRNDGEVRFVSFFVSQR